MYMMYVALAEAVVIAVVAISFAGIVRWLVRQQARERDLLVNQLCALAGRPWREPPAWHPEEPEEEPRVLVTIPDQLPDY